MEADYGVKLSGEALTGLDNIEMGAGRILQRVLRD